MLASKITSIGEAPDNAYRRSECLRGSDAVVGDALEEIPQRSTSRALPKNVLYLRSIKPALAGKPLQQSVFRGSEAQPQILW
jgi:hypothetical protein